MIGVHNWSAQVLLYQFPTESPPALLATHQYWKHILSGTHSCSEHSHLPVPLNFHIPDLCLDFWKLKGFQTVNDLYDGSTMKLFCKLRATYNLLDSAYFKYMQIHHYLWTLTQRQRNILSSVASFLKTSPIQNLKGTKVFNNLFTKKHSASQNRKYAQLGEKTREVNTLPPTGVGQLIGLTNLLHVPTLKNNTKTTYQMAIYSFNTLKN